MGNKIAEPCAMCTDRVAIWTESEIGGVCEECLEHFAAARHELAMTPGITPAMRHPDARNNRRKGAN